MARSLAKRVWRVAFRTDAAISLAVSAWTALTVGGIGAVLVAFWATIRHLEPPAIATLGIVAFAALWWIARQAQSYIKQQPVKLKPIERKIFRQETVRLDGLNHIECEFHNCTLQYDGGDMNLERCAFFGPPSVTSTNGSVIGTLQILRALNALKEGPVTVTLR